MHFIPNVTVLHRGLTSIPVEACLVSMTEASQIKLQNTLDRIAGAILLGIDLNPPPTKKSNGRALYAIDQCKTIKKQLNVTLVTSGVTKTVTEE